MSLPSTAYFIKNGDIVASAMINVGWFVTATGIIDCCYEAYNTCLEAENNELENITKRPIACLIGDWKSFDHILLYDHIIPRIILDTFFLGKITKDEFADIFKDGSYNREGHKWVNDNKITIKDFRKKVEEKYDMP